MGSVRLRCFCSKVEVFGMWKRKDRLLDGILGAGRPPGPIGRTSPCFSSPTRNVTPSSLSNQAPNFGPRHGPHFSDDVTLSLSSNQAPNWVDEVARQRFLAIRRRMRDLIEAETLPTDGVILYSGTKKNVLNNFKSYLASQGYQNTVYLEMTQAGKYLEEMTDDLLKNYLPDADWNSWVTFSGNDGSFTVSLMGFWRELSARFAKKARGCVHVLLTNARLELPEVGQMFWETRLHGGEIEGLRAKDFLSELKTFGFVEFPILFGQISKNAGVRLIKVYEWKGGGSFTFVRDVSPQGTLS